MDFKILSLLALFVILTASCFNNIIAQQGEKVFLYQGVEDEDDPCLFVNLLEGQQRMPAVLIFPGGGYQSLAMEHEGETIASWFLERNIHAIIVKYSLGSFDGSGSKHPDMLNDAKRAIRITRSRAAEWNIDPNKIAIMGFSAGGHLASSLATHADSGQSDAVLEVDKKSCVPNLCILAYPVIIMEGEYVHWGSRRFLLGPTPRNQDALDLSNERHVNSTTPPTFLFHTSDDPSVPVQNSINYYLALRQKGIPTEMHIFEHGRHGAGLLVDDFALGQWEGLLENWLIRWKWISE